MPSRIRIGPEGGPYVILDENNGVLDIEVPDDTVNWQNNEFLNAVLGGALNAAGHQIQNPVLQGASLADALNANENDISGVGAFDSESVNTESLATGTERIIQLADASDERIKIAKETSINGTEIWEFTDFSDDVRSSPTVVDGVLYVGSNDNTVRAIDVSDGTEIWEFTDFSDSVSSSPMVADGVLYVGSNDNTLRAIDAVNRFARLYVADDYGWIPLHKGPNEPPRVAGSTQTGGIRGEEGQ